MKKKIYQSPQMKVVKVQQTQIICASPDTQTNDLVYDTEYEF